jgi:hypothetical protein
MKIMAAIYLWLTGGCSDSKDVYRKTQKVPRELILLG